MAMFGTIDWYTEQLVENRKERDILLHALKDVAKGEINQYTDYTLLCEIAMRLTANIKAKEYQMEQLDSLRKAQGVVAPEDEDYREYND